MGTPNWLTLISVSLFLLTKFSLLVFFRLQVLANSGIASVLVVTIWVFAEGQDKCLNSKDSALITSLIGGVIGHYSCCNGDTWSSELGILSDDQPRLITTFKVNNLLVKTLHQCIFLLIFGIRLNRTLSSVVATNVFDVQFATNILMNV